jgi:hypothetical protein
VEGRDYQSNCSKYHVTPYDIYKPDAQSGLKPNSVLLIGKQSVATTPVASASKTNAAARSHTVAAKETLYGIETYNISDEDLKKANPFLEKTACKLGKYSSFLLKGKGCSWDGCKSKSNFSKYYPKKLSIR